ncbi:protein glass-like [Prorops nasuta]|uniref:protein glass-like n=1 Tax=Prorops nasuta TaxID=863751 RepID=UPI0034CEE77C
MLHSTLPRAFLSPGLSYMGYYGDEVHHPYASATTWHIPIEDASAAYARMAGHQQQRIQSCWEPTARSSSPCPLDLSLKAPAPTPSTSCTEEPIEVEVDDEEDRKLREDVQRTQNYHREPDEDTLIVDDLDSPPRSSSVQSHQSYDRLLAKKEINPVAEVADKSRSLHETRLPLYPSNVELSSRYQLHSQKLLLSSPTQLQSMQSYHHPLLLTPQHPLQSIHAPMTPPSTPSPPQCPRRRPRDEDVVSPAAAANSMTATPNKQQSSSEKSSTRPKKKHARRLKFDEDTSSPVSGTVILGPDEAVVTGDIDPAFNIVEVTEEARAELAKIENRLGPYQCKLCRQLHEDAFQLAQHRCSRIAHVEYRCPECDKRFSCPANLASHRRWHKPRLLNGETSTAIPEIPCTRCDAKFTRQAALRKHLASQHPETNGAASNNNNNNNDSVGEGQDDRLRKTDLQVSGQNPLTTEMP